MSAVEKIEQYVAGIKAERLAWISEKPKVPLPNDAEAFLAALRGEWRWYRDQRERLVKARDAIEALIEDCDMSMSETEHAASLMDEISEKKRKAAAYSDEAA